MVILLYIVENKRVKTRNENDKAFRKKNERVAGFIGELVRGARDIKMLNAENSFTTELTGKITELNKRDIGQIQIYMNYIDENLRKFNQDKTIGIIICKQDNKYVIKYCSDDRIIAREYELVWYNNYRR